METGSGDHVRAPLVRVRDASLAPHGGPIQVTVSRLEAPHAVVDALAASAGSATIEHGRLTAVATSAGLVDAVGRSLGHAPADALDRVLRAAVDAWLVPPPDLTTPAGTLLFSRRPLIMGVLNVTPDSFSDGGRYYDPSRHPKLAIDHGRALAASGADVVDVGGESTRPGAEPVPEAEELRRVVPVVEALAAEGVTVSIDTSKAGVVRAAVDAGAAIVNDVSAGSLDNAMLPMVAELGVPYVVMHMLGTPRTMQRNPRYEDVVAEVFDFLGVGLERCTEAGMDSRRVVVDPGVGFGKTVDHNLLLLRRLRELTSLGRPVLVGTSRKSFIGRLGGGLPELERLEGSLATAVLAVANGAAMVRVHDVRETVRAVRVAHAVATGEWSEE